MSPQEILTFWKLAKKQKPGVERDRRLCESVHPATPVGGGWGWGGVAQHADPKFICHLSNVGKYRETPAVPNRLEAAFLSRF